MSPVPPITTIFIVISVTPTNACRSHQSLVSLRWNVRSIVTRSMDLFKPDEVVLQHALDAPIQDQRGRGYGDESGTSASGFQGNEDHHSAISRGERGNLRLASILPPTPSSGYFRTTVNGSCRSVAPQA